MLKKGMAVLSFLGLALLANLFFEAPTVIAAEQTANGCFLFEGQPPICPDKYCMPGTASCSNDGQRCYCRTQVLANSSKNQSCEIIFGSRMVFQIENNQIVIYAYGGIWSEIARDIPEAFGVGTINGQKAVVFRHAYGKTYRSNFLSGLARLFKDDYFYNYQQTYMMAIDADINPLSGVGTISNPRFEIGSENKNPSDPGNYSCALLQYGSNPFFLKHSTFSIDPFNVERNKGQISPCVFPPTLMSLFVFGKNSESSLFRVKPQIALTRNCTDQKYENEAHLITKIFSALSQDNIELPILMTNLITPQGQSRKVYMVRPDNFILGEVLDGSNQLEKLDRIAQRCNDLTICKSRNPPSDCKFCNSIITRELKADPNKTLNDVLLDNLVKDNAAVCDFIDASLDEIPGKTTGQKAGFNIAALSNNSDNLALKSDEEKALDATLPQGIVNLCDADHLSKSDRLKCKNSALKCYLGNLSELEPVDMCSQLTGELESSRWIICPLSNTLSSAGDRIGWFLEKAFAIDGQNIFNSQTFKTAWANFRNFANIGLVLVTLWIIFAQITGVGLSNYNLKKILPKLLVAILLVNLSLFVAQIAVDLSNIAGQSFYELFLSFADAIKSSGAAKISLSSIAIGVLSGAGILAILGGLVLLLPALIAMIIGLIFSIIMLSLRHALLIILLLSMPLAFIAGIVPGFDNLFQKWSKNMLNVLLAYPIIGLLYGAGTFLKYLIISVAQDNATLQIVAFATPVVALCATPLVLINTTKGLASLHNFLQNSQQRASQFGQQAAKNSDLGHAIKANQQRTMLNLPIDKLLSNRGFNTIFSGAGNSLLKQRNRQYAIMRSAYSNIIGDDTEMVNAFHQEKGLIGGAAYQALSQSQQQKYRQLAELGAMKDAGFYNVSLNKLAANGGITQDGSDIMKIITNAQKNKIDNSTISSNLFVSSKIAEKAGNPMTSGVMANISKSYSDNGEFSLDKNTLHKDIKNAFNKARPGDLKEADFLVPNSLARQTFNQLIQFNSKQAPRDSYLMAIGEDYGKMSHTIIAGSQQEIIASINDYRLSVGLDAVNYSSAEAALRSEKLFQPNIGGKI